MILVRIYGENTEWIIDRETEKKNIQVQFHYMILQSQV